jgi:PKHD-type hydroxylase
MMLEIPELLDPATLSAIQEIAARDQLFVDGRSTAGWHARERKHNLQAAESGLVTGLLKKVEQSIMQHALVQIAVRPRNLIRLMLSRYDQGMYYGSHVDDALMDSQRTDISFTLFITPPESYDGGALVIDETCGERHIKLSAGSLFLYPSDSLHRVEPVTRGSRLVVVGWLRSHIRDAYQREIVFDLDRAIGALRDNEIDRDQLLALLLKSRSNLLRLWVDS